LSEELQLVDDEAGLDEVVRALEGVDAYAVDTEFHRERTYFPKVALVQIAWPGGSALIDPLAVPLRPLASVLDGPGIAVMHACSQDLEVMQRACGTIPSRIFDTQLAAGFVGFSTPSLTALVERVLGVKLPKGNRLTDWLRRPLQPEQLSYAADDVAHLLELAATLRAELDRTARLGWAEEECEELRAKGWGPPDPDAAWLRLKESRSLRGSSRGVAQAVAAWRERRAAETDQPVRFVLPDLAIIGIANNPPKSMEQLKSVRGLDERHARGRTGESLMAAVQEGRSLPPEALRRPRRDDVEREVRPAVALVSAWLSQLSRDLLIDTSLLATRADLSAFLSNDPNARLARGWRAELLGEPIRRLVDGDFALAFDGKGGLDLERRSRESVTIDLPVPEARWT
jgi:ribonuclease D